MRLAPAVVAAMLVSAVPTFAQLNGQNIKGDTGLKSASQAPTGTYVAVPLWFYSADAVKNRDGEEILAGNLDAALFGLALNVVTKKRILGANYGFLVVLPWANNPRPGRRRLRLQSGRWPDRYVHPARDPGWHKPRADVMAAYGMWAHEILLGTTIYLNKERTWHAAATATLDFQSQKADSDTSVSNILGDVQEHIANTYAFGGQ